MWLGELCSSNPLRIPYPKFDKLACRAQGVGIFAEGESTLHGIHDTQDTYFILTEKSGAVFAAVGLSALPIYSITSCFDCQ